MKAIARPMYSSPPLHGALIVTKVLQDRDLKDLWYKVWILNSKSRFKFKSGFKSSHQTSGLYFTAVFAYMPCSIALKFAC